MAFCYTNRRGVAYYLHASRTKTGKTRYTMKRSAPGALEELPEGYEAVESVNAQVSVRRSRAPQILPMEEELVASEMAACGLDAYRLEVKGKYITVFAPLYAHGLLAQQIEDPVRLVFGDAFAAQVERQIRREFGDEAMDEHLRQRREEHRRALADRELYDPQLRFVLVGAADRTFCAERMTYRGDGGWWFLAAGPLAALAKRYLPHLGKESFFELL